MAVIVDDEASLFLQILVPEEGERGEKIRRNLMGDGKELKRIAEFSAPRVRPSLAEIYDFQILAEMESNEFDIRFRNGLFSGFVLDRLIGLGSLNKAFAELGASYRGQESFGDVPFAPPKRAARGIWQEYQRVSHVWAGLLWYRSRDDLTDQMKQKGYNKVDAIVQLSNFALVQVENLPRPKNAGPTIQWPLLSFRSARLLTTPRLEWDMPTALH